jgi:hypothetical protein
MEKSLCCRSKMGSAPLDGKDAKGQSSNGRKKSGRMTQMGENRKYRASFL